MIFLSFASLIIVRSSCAASASPRITGSAVVGAANLNSHNHRTLEHVHHAAAGIRRKSFALGWVSRARGGGGSKVI